MEQEHLLILELLEEGKITVPEALDLIEAIDASEEETARYGQTLTLQVCLN
jgi:hypothetical protein